MFTLTLHDFSSVYPSLPYLPFFVSFKKSISKEVCGAQIFLDVWSSPGVTRSYTCREIVPSSHSSCWLPVASWPGWDCVLSFCSWLGLACLGLGMAMRSFVQLLWCVQKTLSPCSCLLLLSLTLFPRPLFHWSLSLGRGCAAYMFQLGLSTLQSLSFCALAPFWSLLITIYYKQKFLKLRLIDVFIYGVILSH